MSKKVIGNFARIGLRLIYWATVCAIALVLFAYFCRTSGVGGHGPAKVSRILTGTADRPYAFRVLLPVIANGLAPLLDPHLALAIGTKSEVLLGDRFFTSRMSGATYPSQAALILGTMYLSLVGFAVALHYLAKELGYAAWVQYAAPPALLVGSILFMNYGYIYDFSALFLFSLSLLLMLQKRWASYLVAFAAATLNKETSVFLVPTFILFYFGRMLRRRFFLLGAAQIVVYGAIQGGIRYAFRNNPGSTLQWHLPDQLKALHEAAANSPMTLALIGALVVTIAVFVGYGWKRKPQFLRASLWLAPIFIALFVTGGFPGEIRTMLEIYPIVALLMLPPQLLTASEIQLTERRAGPVLASNPG